jgi:hypothetical protein
VDHPRLLPYASDKDRRPDFTLNPATMKAVIRICRQVEGNPFGILLVAAWVEHFSPDEIFTD